MSRRLPLLLFLHLVLLSHHKAANAPLLLRLVVIPSLKIVVAAATAEYVHAINAAADTNDDGIDAEQGE